MRKDFYSQTFCCFARKYSGSERVLDSFDAPSQLYSWLCPCREELCVYPPAESFDHSPLKVSVNSIYAYSHLSISYFYSQMPHPSLSLYFSPTHVAASRLRRPRAQDLVAHKFSVPITSTFDTFGLTMMA